jgi:hypothetical protein
LRGIVSPFAAEGREGRCDPFLLTGETGEEAEVPAKGASSASFLCHQAANRKGSHLDAAATAAASRNDPRLDRRIEN